jgi:hypothetical protein
MWQKVRFDTVNFSAFYFANLWVCFVSLFFLKDWLAMLGNYATNLAQTDLQVKNTSGSLVFYWSLILVYFLVVSLAMMMIMKPLHIHLPDNNVQGAETFLTFILILGFFFYTFHKTFINVAMPDGVPAVLADLIMGQGKFISGASTRGLTSVIWGNISNFIWCFLPIGFMWFRAKTGG